jgi:hypothetical protein
LRWEREGPLPTRLLDNAPDSVPTAAEREGLAEIRRRRTTIWLLLLLGMPVLAITSAFVPDRIRTILLALGMLVIAISIVRHNLAACPRCGDRFSYLNPWTQACVFCGLKLRETPPTPSGADEGRRS